MLRVERIVQLSTDIGEIDLLDRPIGFPSYGLVTKLSEYHDLNGVRVRALTIEGLLRAKNALRRPKDLQDVAELCALREARELLAHDSNSLRLHESP